MRSLLPHNCNACVHGVLNCMCYVELGLHPCVKFLFEAALVMVLLHLHPPPPPLPLLNLHQDNQPNLSVQAETDSQSADI